MPTTKQGAKRLRQAKERNLRNRMVKSELKTFTRKVMEALEAKDTPAAQELLRKTHAKLDRAAQKGILHRNTVNRRKSLLSRKVADLAKN